MSLEFFNRKHKMLNVDITHRCPLECLRCGRQTSFRNQGLAVPGHDLSLDDFEKITNHFPEVSFCGQYSDPIHHPQFLDILAICKKKNIQTEVHVASSFKPKKFFIDAFKTYPEARWVFGIDGLPEESHNYRVNQDGVKLFEIMLESKKHLKNKPNWQYIIFKYNENSIDNAKLLAKEHNLNFMIINSARWIDKDDYLRPSIKG
jgi:MoaA/NifB/PqqE/SkfB family radical SAM enzyme